MTSDALSVVQCLFESIWSIFTSWHIPGTATTPAAFFIFVLFACLGLRLVKRLFSSSSGGDSE